MQAVNAQLPLFDSRKRRLAIQQRFEAFHAAHPEVFQLFARFASELRRAGRTHYSADAILHRVRWECAVNPERDSGYKINDHFSSRYARKLANTDPRFATFFEFRKLREPGEENA